jgi:hypothetical protein
MVQSIIQWRRGCSPLQTSGMLVRPCFDAQGKLLDMGQTSMRDILSLITAPFQPSPPTSAFISRVSRRLSPANPPLAADVGRKALGARVTPVRASYLCAIHTVTNIMLVIMA